MLAPDRHKAKFDILTQSDWLILKQVRLDALADSPKAFVPDVCVERRLPDREWQTRLADGTWVVASAEGRQVAVAHLTEGEKPESGVLFIESVWVAPEFRRTGVVRDLLAQLESRARALNTDELHLWVLEENHEAWDAYQRLGFDPTIDVQNCRTHLGPTTERRMTKKLT